MKRKPFDLEAAKRGEPVVTRDGRPWRYGCHFADAPPKFRVAGWAAGAGQCPGYWWDDGTYEGGRFESELDLFMAPRRVQAWARLYRSETGVYMVSSALTTKGDAPAWRIDRNWLSDAVKVGEPQDEGGE